MPDDADRERVASLRPVGSSAAAPSASRTARAEPGPPGVGILLGPPGRGIDVGRVLRPPEPERLAIGRDEPDLRPRRPEVDPEERSERGHAAASSARFSTASAVRTSVTSTLGGRREARPGSARPCPGPPRPRSRAGRRARSRASNAIGSRPERLGDEPAVDREWRDQHLADGPAGPDLGHRLGPDASPRSTPGRRSRTARRRAAPRGRARSARRGGRTARRERRRRRAGPGAWRAWTVAPRASPTRRNGSAPAPGRQNPPHSGTTVASTVDAGRRQLVGDRRNRGAIADRRRPCRRECALRRTWPASRPTRRRVTLRRPVERWAPGGRPAARTDRGAHRPPATGPRPDRRSGSPRRPARAPP